MLQKLGQKGGVQAYNKELSLVMVTEKEEGGQAWA
jgi:hypothetical protein